jgi:hypothetical protein
MKRASFLGELQIARATLEQSKLKGSLKFCYSSRQGRLRTACGTRCFAEAAIAGNEIEIGKSEEVHERFTCGTARLK